MSWPEAVLLLKARRRQFIQMVQAALYAKAGETEQGRFLISNLEADG